MEDAPTPAFPIVNEMIESSKDFILKLNNKDYVVKLILSYFITINIQEKDNIYSNVYYLDLTLKEFHELNKLFKQYETLEDCYNCLLKFFDKNKVSIFNKEEKMMIKIQINSLFGDSEEITLSLEKKLINLPENNNSLLKEIDELKTKVKSLEEESKDLRKIIENLKKENSSYKAIIESRLLKLEKIFLGESNLNINSNIIKTNEEFNFILERLQKNFKKIITINLIYRATIDGDEPSDFHRKCDKKINVLVLYHTTKNIIFGGFSSVGFDSSNCAKTDLNSFIFNVNNKKIYEACGSNQIGCFAENGPFFGRFNSAIYMYDGVNFLTEKKSEHKTNKKIVSFEGLDNNNFEINNGEQFFNLIELEVFQIE